MTTLTIGKVAKAAGLGVAVLALQLRQRAGHVAGIDRALYGLVGVSGG